MGTILDEPLASVIEGLYSVPRSYSEYDFSQMEPDVLGEVYEQYLGYVPSLVQQIAGRAVPDKDAVQITLESKQKRRKQHGIFYTPRWVLQYIVEQTVGRVLGDGRMSNADDRLAILDPACGSGSFLIRAYEALLDRVATVSGVDALALSTDVREALLRRNIYGVDIDPQAVRIARLSLLMRMVRNQEPLPELKDNIVHGNSLVDGSPEELRSCFGEQWEQLIPLRWERRFERIMGDGGFDIISVIRRMVIARAKRRL